MNNWKSFGAYAQGISHKQDNLICQDRTYSLVQNQISVIALADGAGSYAHSEEGAEVVTKAIAEYLTDNFAQIYADESNAIIHEIEGFLITKLTTYATEKNYELDDLSSTLLAVAVDIAKKQYLAVHIGDGVIGVNKDSNLELLSEPQNGDSPNMTFMTTSDKLHRYIRIYKGDLVGINGFSLMSDGAAHVLFAYKTKEFSNNARVLLNHALDDKMSDKLLQSFVSDFLVPNCGCFDDCSIALLIAFDEKEQDGIMQGKEEVTDESLDVFANKEVNKNIEDKINA